MARKKSEKKDFSEVASAMDGKTVVGEPEGQQLSAAVEPVEGSAGHENPVKEAEQEPEGQRFSAVVEPVEGSAGQEAPVKKTAGEPENAAGTDPAEDRIFRITCRNKISESIGGVEFVDGTGYTRDGFSASWFANKSGYTVSRADSGE